MSTILVADVLTKLDQLAADLARGGVERTLRRDAEGQITGSVERPLDGDVIVAQAVPLLAHLKTFLDADPPPDQAAELRRAGLAFYDAATNAAPPDARSSWAAGRDKWLPPGQ